MLLLNLVISSLIFELCHGVDTNALAKQIRFECLSDPRNHLQDAATNTTCKVKFDGGCWKETPVNQSLTISCPWLFFYETSNVTSKCGEGGIWTMANYTAYCTLLSKSDYQQRIIALLNRLGLYDPPSSDPHTDRLILVYLTMQWISFAVIFPAAIALIFIPTQMSVKISLHRNLVLAFLGGCITFLVDFYSVKFTTPNMGVCNTVWIINRFFAVSEITWMFNEGLYLLKLLLFTYDYKSYWRHLFIFGWGFPALLVLAVWVPVMNYKLIPFTRSCWAAQAQSHLMLVLYIPMTLMLLINLCILIYVVVTLIKKLKLSPAGENRKIKKAVRGALLLLPLLGGIYMLIFYSPRGLMWYNYMLNIIQPMQGILVCIIHVYLDKEVRESLRNRVRKFLARFNLAPASCYSKDVRADLTRTKTLPTRLDPGTGDRRRSSNRISPSLASDRQIMSLSPNANETAITIGPNGAKTKAEEDHGIANERFEMD